MKYRVSIIVDDLDPILGSLGKDLVAYGELIVTEFNVVRPPAPAAHAPARRARTQVGGRAIVLEALAKENLSSMQLRDIYEAAGKARKGIDGVMSWFRAVQMVERVPGGKWKLTDKGREPLNS